MGAGGDVMTALGHLADLAAVILIPDTTGRRITRGQIALEVIVGAPVRLAVFGAFATAALVNDLLDNPRSRPAAAVGALTLAAAAATGHLRPANR